MVRILRKLFRRLIAEYEEGIQTDSLLRDLSPEVMESIYRFHTKILRRKVLRNLKKSGMTMKEYAAALDQIMDVEIRHLRNKFPTAAMDMSVVGLI